MNANAYRAVREALEELGIPAEAAHYAAWAAAKSLPPNREAAQRP